MLKLIAMLTMLVDHIGLLFFPHNMIYRIIGRLSMPLFAYGIALGYKRTQLHGTTPQYIFRMTLIFLSAQIPYTLAHLLIGTVPNFNICLSWVLGLCLLCVVDRPLHYLTKTIVISLVVVVSLSNFWDYSFLAIGLVLTYSMGLRIPKGVFLAPAAAAGLTILYAMIYHNPLQLWSLVSLPLIAVVQQGRGGRIDSKVRVPKIIGYAFYPAHLAVLCLIKALL